MKGRGLILIFVWVALCLAAPSAHAEAPGAPAQAAIQAYTQAGQLYAAKDYAGALKAYEQALALKPDLYQAAQGMGNCRYAMGDKAGALKGYEQARVLGGKAEALDPMITRLKRELGQGQTFPASPPGTAPEEPIHSAWSGMWRSMLLPGWGQAYNDQNTKAWIYGGLCLASLGFTAYEYVAWDSASKRYSEPGLSRAQRREIGEQVDSAALLFEVGALTFIVLNISNIVDAGISGARLRRLEEQKRNQGSLQPILMADGQVGLAYSLEW